MHQLECTVPVDWLCAVYLTTPGSTSAVIHHLPLNAWVYLNCRADCLLVHSNAHSPPTDCASHHYSPRDPLNAVLFGIDTTTEVGDVPDVRTRVWKGVISDGCRVASSVVVSWGSCIRWSVSDIPLGRYWFYAADLARSSLPRASSRTIAIALQSWQEL